MNLKNFCAVVILMLLIFIPKVDAAEKPTAIVIDVGTGIPPVADFLMEHLFESNRFLLKEYDALELLSEEENLEITGDTPLERAKDFAAKFDVDYIVYGDFDFNYGNSFIAEPKFRDGIFKSVKVTLIVHMLDVKTGKIVLAVKGEGISKRSEDDTPKNLKENVVPLICIRNATYKAAKSAGDNLIKNFFEVKGA